jgi:hypothetical protein
MGVRCERHAERAAEHGAVLRLELLQVVSRNALPGGRLECDCAEGIDIGLGVGRRILRSRGELRANLRESARDTEARNVHGVGRDHDVSGMQQAVMHAAPGGVIDGAGERIDERHHIMNRQSPALAQDDVERIADGVFLSEKHSAVFQPC